MAVRTVIVDNHQDVGWLAAEIIVSRAAQLHPRPLRAFVPTGRTPEPLYERLRDYTARYRPEVSFELYQLDEYCGIPLDDPRSYRQTLSKEVGDLPNCRLVFLDPDDPEGYERQLAETTIHLAVLGVGRNGHVAFNEPGSSADSTTRRVRLADSTLQANAPVFGTTPPAEAVTVGIATLRRCEEILILANGEHKQQAVQRLQDGAPDVNWPVTLLADHPRLTLICDRAAAGMSED